MDENKVIEALSMCQRALEDVLWQWAVLADSAKRAEIERSDAFEIAMAAQRAALPFLPDEMAVCAKWSDRVFRAPEDPTDWIEVRAALDRMMPEGQIPPGDRPVLMAAMDADRGRYLLEHSAAQRRYDERE